MEQSWLGLQHWLWGGYHPNKFLEGLEGTDVGKSVMGQEPAWEHSFDPSVPLQPKVLQNLLNFSLKFVSVVDMNLSSREKTSICFEKFLPTFPQICL